MPIGLYQTVAPTQEPLSLAEVKDWLRIDADDTSQDATVLPALITAAREYAEAYLSRSLLTQTWRYTLDRFPVTDKPDLPVIRPPWALVSQAAGAQASGSGTIYLPRPPLQSVSSVVYVDTTGATQTLDPSTYQVQTDDEPGRLIPAFGKSWPGTREQLAAVTITFVAGWQQPANVPVAVKQAMKLLIGFDYENREATQAQTDRVHDLLDSASYGPYG